MRRADRIVGLVSAVLAVVAALCTLAMMLVMVADVVARTTTGGSIPGAYEVTTTLLVMVVFLGIGYAERSGTNVRVSLATDRLPSRVAQAMRVLGGVVSLVVIVWFAYATWDAFSTSVERGEFSQGIVDFPLWPAKLVIAVGYTVLSLEVLLGIWRHITGAKVPPIGFVGIDSEEATA